jgi:hypothetical protein
MFVDGLLEVGEPRPRMTAPASMNMLGARTIRTIVTDLA